MVNQLFFVISISSVPGRRTDPAGRLYQSSVILTHLTAGPKSAQQTRTAPWCPPTTSGPQRIERTLGRGLRWGRSAPRVRFGTRPMRRHRASHRACPDGPICRHEMSQYQRALVLVAVLRQGWRGSPPLSGGGWAVRNRPNVSNLTKLQCVAVTIGLLALPAIRRQRAP